MSFGAGFIVAYIVIIIIIIITIINIIINIIMSFMPSNFMPLKHRGQTMVLGYQRIHFIERTLLKMWVGIIIFFPCENWI